MAVAEVETVVTAVVVELVLVDCEAETGYRVEVMRLMEDMLAGVESSVVVVVIAAGVTGANADVVLLNVPTKVVTEGGIVVISVLM